MIGWKMMAGGGVAAFLVGVSYGWTTGYNRAFDNAERDAQARADKRIEQAEKEVAAASIVIDRTVLERNHCFDEVEKINAAHAATEAAYDKALADDEKARRRAEHRNQIAERQAQEQLAEATQKLLDAGKVLIDAADECASARVHDNLVGVLNDIAATANIGGGELPAAEGD